MPSLFSRIISGELPCYKIAEDDRFFAFLDIMPVRPGHVLVVPKTLVDVLWDAPADTLSALLNFAQPIAKAIQQSVPCNRCGMAVLGLDVPHAHLHLVPVNSAADLDFTQTRKKAAPEALAAMQSLLLSALRNKQ